MKVIVAVNRVSEIGYRQTTALLIAALVRRGLSVCLADAGDFSIDSSNVSLKTGESPPTLHASCLIIPPDSECDSETVQRNVSHDDSRLNLALQTDDLILIRTNPGRDKGRAAVHESFLDICRAASLHGFRVVNDPNNLRFFASKASLAVANPEFRPPMILSSQPALVAGFVRRAGKRCVVKPLVGSRGQDVISVEPDHPAIESMIENTFAGAGVVAQHFVNADFPGDKRVVVLNGKILESNGHLAGIERRAAPDDFRGNLHAGGSAHPLILSPEARNAAEYAANLLMKHGIALAGVDLIGDQIIEFNVFSTGGLYDAERFSGVGFSDLIVSELIA